MSHGTGLKFFLNKKMFKSVSPILEISKNKDVQNCVTKNKSDPWYLCNESSGAEKSSPIEDTVELTCLQSFI